MPRETESFLNEYIEKVKNIYNQSICKIILYGSYARGDFKSDSDIDIMVLVKLTDEEIKKLRRQLSDMTFDYNLDNDLDIKPMVVGIDHFEYWKQCYPFYSNVIQEGVVLYGAA